MKTKLIKENDCCSRVENIDDGMLTKQKQFLRFTGGVITTADKTHFNVSKGEGEIIDSDGKVISIKWDEIKNVKCSVFTCPDVHVDSDGIISKHPA
jgi:hypothetical protein